MTVEEAAQRVGVSQRRVRAMIAGGSLQAERRGGRYLIERAAVDALAGAGRQSSRPLAPRSTLYRLRRTLQTESSSELTLRLRHAQKRSSIQRWRVLASDIERLRNDRRLVATGLAADDPLIAVRYQPERDGYDGYVSAENLLALRRELHPEEKASSPNVTLRVPIQSDWVLLHERTPSAVVAADLLDCSDERVRRAALRAFERLLHGTLPPRVTGDHLQPARPPADLSIQPRSEELYVLPHNVLEPKRELR